jgi:histidinol phosphatase-like enzyme
MKKTVQLALSFAISTGFLTVAFATTQQVAARGSTEAEACTKAHNEINRWLQQNGWQLKATGRQLSEGECSCRGDATSGYYCEIAISY